jgi:hypothetical protein
MIGFLCFDPAQGIRAASHGNPFTAFTVSTFTMTT